MPTATDSSTPSTSTGVTSEADDVGLTPADLADLQANVVRGYSAGRARHFALSIATVDGAAAFLRAVLPEAAGDGPKISTAEHWSEKPSYCMTIGFTWNGLHACGLPESLLALFPAAFQQGPATPADKVTTLGDTGESAPDRWMFGGPTTPDVHAVLSLYTHAHATGPIDALTAQLDALFAQHGLTVLNRLDANALPDGKVHFGYKDGIGQPRIKGVPGRQRADMQPECSPGEFLLGRSYKNQYNGNFIGDLPPALCNNATYGAFRVLQQDVVAFEQLIQRSGERFRMDPEMVAAKMMGRWRDGAPLTLAPDGPNPPPDEPGHVSSAHLDRFDYAPTKDRNTYFDDSEGQRCPVGSHARRMNPRSARVMGKPYSRRIIRRAIAYGAAYDPATGDDGVERGLVGYFICGDLAMQFEFLLGTWANMDLSAVGMPAVRRDPILGANPESGGQFVIRTTDSRDPIVISDVPRLVSTRGSVYCLMPGIGGLRFLASSAPA